jgi:nicotinamidase-related amidase
VTIDLAEVVAPEHTAIVTQEYQGAVMGPNAGLAVLAEEARREALPNIVRLLPAARAVEVSIVHCLVQRRPDGLGSNHNAKIFAGARTDVDIAPGSEGCCRDAVAGFPTEYGNAIIEHTLSLLATITTTDDLLRAWTPS